MYLQVELTQYAPLEEGIRVELGQNLLGTNKNELEWILGQNLLGTISQIQLKLQ